MRSGRLGRRGLLVACNVLLLSAALPAVGQSQQLSSQKAKGGSSYEQKPKRQVTKPSNEHEASGRVRPNKTTAHKSQASSSSSSSDDDDDDDNGGEVAGEILGACCVGAIGAMASSDANDPSDVEPYPPDRPPEPRAPDWEGPPPTERPAEPGPFDAQAAKDALELATEEVRERCVEQGGLGEHKLRVTFQPDGSASAVGIEPPFAIERQDECARDVYSRARVPRYSGEEVTVTKTLKGTTPPP